MLIEPLHIATIRGQQLRFYRTPNNDGCPDLPWHNVDDLQKCLGLSRQQRKFFLKEEWASEFKSAFKSIAAANGIVVIAPHFVAQGTIDAMQDCMGDVEDVDRDYHRGGVVACKKLTSGLSFENGLLEWMAAAFHRHKAV